MIFQVMTTSTVAIIPTSKESLFNNFNKGEEMTTATTTTSLAHKGRWGYYACSYEDFKKIKLLHKHYWIALSKKAAHDRYYAKHPHNRVIRRRNGLVLPVPEPKPEPFFPSIYDKIIKKPIVALYHHARHPVQTAEEVKMLPIFIKQVEEWLNEIEKA